MFKIIENKNGTFRFNLFAQNGERILVGEDYVTKAGAENSVELTKKYAFYDDCFEKLNNKLGKPYFILKAKNGQVIGESRIYESEAARDNGMDVVKKYAQWNT